MKLWANDQADIRNPLRLPITYLSTTLKWGLLDEVQLSFRKVYLNRFLEYIVPYPLFPVKILWQIQSDSPAQ